VHLCTLLRRVNSPPMLLQRKLHVVLALVFVTGVITVAKANVSASAGPPIRAASSASTSSGVHPLAATTPSLRREVFGFGLASSLSDPTIGYPSWNFSLLSTVAFFGLHINWDGTVAGDNGWSVWNSSALGALLSAAHAKGTKVVVTIVLQDFQAGTPNMCAGLINRAVTVGETVAQVKAKGVDGVNVDYEGLNGTCQNGQTSQSMLTDFARQLRASLPSGSYLSVDTYASSASDSLGFFDVPGLNAYVDSFFVMAYDLEYSNYRRSPLNCASFCLSPTAPLTGYFYNDTSTASQYTAAVPASKVILGVPYYGRKSCVAQAAPNQIPTSSVVADTYLDASTEGTDPSVQSGSYGSNRDANDPAGQERWDTWYNTSLGCRRELYWDDTVSLGAKYDLVNRDGLRGVGIWNLNYGGGAPELWSTLASHFAGCQSAALTAAPASQATVGAPVTFSGSATGCPDPSPLYQFWMASPGAGWQVVQAYSASPTFAWNTTGKAAGTYSVSVWVRDAASAGTSGNNSGRWDAYASFQYTLIASPCSATNLTASPPSSDGKGNAITFSAAATGCPNPLYQFWLAAPGATSWQVAQAYSNAATFTWNTGSSAVGSYGVSVWARDATSAGVYGNNTGHWDAYSSSRYSLVGPCSSATLTASPATSAASGTVVMLIADSAGCANPVYQFWIAAPGAATWQVAQAYSAGKTFSWDTTGKATGTYGVSVWVRDAGSTGTSANNSGRWDAYSSTQYGVTPYSCASVSLAPVPASSAAVGTSVTLTASASGCANPVYQFWMSAPGSNTWQVVQPYSSAAAFTWNTAGKATGTYGISVWVRDASSTGVHGNNTGRWDAYTSTLYPVTPNSCAAVTLAASPTSPAAAGTSVTLTASASGCPNPVYEFWIATPGSGGWQIVQPYSSSATFTWTTTSKPAGVYSISVWVRDASSVGVNGNSTGRWDAYASGQYSLR